MPVSKHVLIHSGEEASLHCGLSSAFHNKTNLSGGKAAFGRSFEPSAVTPAAFVAHIMAGCAWTQGYFKGRQRRRETFISGQTLALDLDDHISVDDALREPFIREYALLVHPSPSSTPQQPRSRVIFMLSEPVNEAGRWEALQRGLIAHAAHLRPDPACKDAARLFYGSDLPGAYTNLDARLPLHIAGALTSDEARAEGTPPRHESTGFPIVITGNISTRPPTTDTKTLAPALIADVERALGVTSTATNSEGWSRQAIPCPVHRHEHDDTRPAAYWHPGIHALKCFKCGTTYNTHQVAEALNLNPASYYAAPSNDYKKDAADKPKTMAERIKNVTLAPFSADVTVNLPYLSDLDAEQFLAKRAALVRSPIGTGKTEAAARLIQHLGQKLGRRPRVLALTHRQALADDLTRRLNASGYIFESYKGLDAADLRRIDRLVICYDSVWKLASVGERLSQYDLLIIDEIEQFHLHLGGDTMRGGEPERAYRVLRQLVIEAPHFLGMDAHATNTSRLWLESLMGQGSVQGILNTYRKARGQITLHRTRETAIRAALERINCNEGPVVVPTNSRRMAKELGKIFSEHVGEEGVRVIHGGNSHEHHTQAFIREINQALPGLRVLVFSPSLGTGVDITAPVRAVIGVFSRQPLAPADMTQMMGRCRAAQERHAWVEPAGGGRETDWEAIFKAHEAAAHTTGMHCEFNAYGVLAVTDMQLAMLRLLSLLQAERNRTMNDALSHFVALVKHDGYIVNFIEGQDDAIRETMQEARAAIEEAEKAAVLEAEPVDHDQMELHRAMGTQTPDIVAGYTRFKIESCVGQKITAHIYDDLHTAERRDQLRRFTDLLTDERELQAHDRREAAQRTLMTKRRHRARQRELIRAALVAVWGKDPFTACIDPITPEEIAVRLATYLECFRYDLRAHLGWRCDQSQNPVAVLRWMLTRIGLKLQSRQIMREGERIRVYSVSPDSLQKMIRYAASRLALLRRKNEARRRQQGDYSKRGYTSTIPRNEESLLLQQKAHRGPLYISGFPSDPRQQSAGGETPG